MKIYRYALDGGDVGGKSSAEPFLRKEMEKRGYAVAFVPEVPTRLINQFSVNPKKLTANQSAILQELIFATILRDEDEAVKNIKEFSSRKKGIVFCDRGLMSGSAFGSRKRFTKLLRKYGFNRVSARDLRYDAVFHMVTSADGALAVYKREVSKNPARHNRPPNSAIDLDRRLQNAWLGHPHQRIIDNSTDFEGKKQRLLTKILSALGDIETERTFLVKNFLGIEKFPVPIQPIDIVQNFTGLTGRVRFRCREQKDEGQAFYCTTKTNTDKRGSDIEIEKRVSSKDFIYHSAYDLNPDFDTIIKTRYYFSWKSQVFELDILHAPQRHKDLVLLEIELDHEDDKVDLPNWLGDLKEVTEKKKYRNRQLAKKM